MTAANDILYEAHGHVRLITIDRAEKMNSLDFAANDRLIERWREFAADDEARVAVITGAGGKAFCAGADLKTYTMNYAGRPAPEFRTRLPTGPASVASPGGLRSTSRSSRRSTAMRSPAGWSSPRPATSASARPTPSSPIRT